MNSGNYYDDSHPSYIQEVQDVDLSFIYNQFLHLVKKNGTILDAGCGSGRDMLNFKNMGYLVSGFDSSIKMVQSALAYSGCPVSHTSFEMLNYDDEFDAIWACASLLHVERKNLTKVFALLHKALHKEGVLYCSFKARSDDFDDGERSFTCFTPTKLEHFIISSTNFSIINIFISEDVRENRKGEMWTNAILRKA
jgi:SAM-dependent methyltransferase